MIGFAKKRRKYDNVLIITHMCPNFWHIITINMHEADLEIYHTGKL